MNRYKSVISSFFTFLLASGIVITSFHIHELYDLNGQQKDRLIIEDIHLCPLCEAVFEFTNVEDYDHGPLHITLENSPILRQQLFTDRIFTDKDGRSPPVSG